MFSSNYKSRSNSFISQNSLQIEKYDNNLPGQKVRKLRILTRIGFQSKKNPRDFENLRDFKKFSKIPISKKMKKKGRKPKNL